MAEGPPERSGNVRRIGAAWLMTLGAAGTVVLLVLAVLTWLG